LSFNRSICPLILLSSLRRLSISVICSFRKFLSFLSYLVLKIHPDFSSLASSLSCSKKVINLSTLYLTFSISVSFTSDVFNLSISLFSALSSACVVLLIYSIFNHFILINTSSCSFRVSFFSQNCLIRLSMSAFPMVNLFSPSILKIYLLPSVFTFILFVSKISVTGGCWNINSCSNFSYMLKWSKCNDSHLSAVCIRISLLTAIVIE